MQSEIYNLDYNNFVNILGTAHFTRRSLQEACDAVKKMKPSDLAIELDLRRFNTLNRACFHCYRRETCTTKCEFIGATEAMGNIDADIWLIDMSQREIGQRIHRLTTPSWTWTSLVHIPFHNPSPDETQLWEEGFKERVLHSSQKRVDKLRRDAPPVWKVLIDERNTIMAARLAWIATKKLNEESLKILALVGAAHVEGIRNLLENPVDIKENLHRLNLPFTPPTLIRRISVDGD